MCQQMFLTYFPGGVLSVNSVAWTTFVKSIYCRIFSHASMKNNADLNPKIKSVFCQKIKPEGVKFARVVRAYSRFRTYVSNPLQLHFKPKCRPQWWIVKEELQRNFFRHYDSDKSNTIPLTQPLREILLYKRLAIVSGHFLDLSHTSRQNNCCYHPVSHGLRTMLMLCHIFGSKSSKAPPENF